MQRELHEKPRWSVRVTSGRSQDDIRVANQGPIAYDVIADVIGVASGLFSDTFPATELGAGLSGTLNLLRHGGVPGDPVLEISWRDVPDGEVNTWRVTT